MIDRLRNLDICKFVALVASQNRFLVTVMAGAAI